MKSGFFTIQRRLKNCKRKMLTYSPAKAGGGSATFYKKEEHRRMLFFDIKNKKSYFGIISNVAIVPNDKLKYTGVVQ